MLNLSQIEVSKKVIAGLYKGVTTVELDNLAAETAADMMTKHPDYGILAARIAVSNLHKRVTKVGEYSHEKLFTVANIVIDRRTLI